MIEKKNWLINGMEILAISQFVFLKMLINTR